MVENAGDMLAKDSDTEVTLPKEPLLEDMQHHLSFKPKNYLWTIGWRTYVWQEKETGKFKELTDEEFKQTLLGTLGDTRADSPDAGGLTDASGDEEETTE